jgi:hypothetical protein
MTTLQEQSNLSRLIVEETRRRVRPADVPRVVFDVLSELGFDLSREPTVEEIKPILVAAFRAAGRNP